MGDVSNKTAESLKLETVIHKFSGEEVFKPFFVKPQSSRLDNLSYFFFTIIL